MTALYCGYGFPYALGKEDSEREEDYESTQGGDEWDRTFYKRTRRKLRKQFQNYYLSRYLESTLDLEDDDDAERNFRIYNPLADIKFSINWTSGLNWFQRRRLVANPYDANGTECADPIKDLL